MGVGEQLERNAKNRILLQIQSPIKSRVTEFRYSSILERQELCRFISQICLTYFSYLLSINQEEREEIIRNTSFSQIKLRSGMETGPLWSKS